MQQRAFAAAVFGLLSLFSLSAANMVGHPLYLIGFSVAVALLAIVAGWSAARRARKEETARPRGSVAAVILGVISLVLCLFVAAGVVFAKQLDAYEQCVSAAPSSAAKQACAQQFMNSVNQQVQGR